MTLRHHRIRSRPRFQNPHSDPTFIKLVDHPCCETGVVFCACLQISGILYLQEKLNMIVTIGGIPVYDAVISDEETGMFKISLVDDPAVMSNFQAFDAKKKPVMYAIQDEEKRLVRGCIMRADFPIYRRDSKMGEYYVIYKAEEIRKMAEKYGLLVIPGVELTGDAKTQGHFNALFTTDNKTIYDYDGIQAIRNARAQGALIMHNHPGWRHKTLERTPFEEQVYAEKLVDGVEIMNGYRV